MEMNDQFHAAVVRHLDMQRVTEKPVSSFNLVATVFYFNNSEYLMNYEHMQSAHKQLSYM
jgi:hypothetical protein